MTHIELVVWADANPNARTESNLRSIWPTLDIFYELDSCISYTASNVENDNAVILIVSGSLGQHLAPVLDGLPQLRAVYVYCRDLDKHIEWAKQYDKIGLHRVFNRENDLLTQLTTDLKNAEQKELLPNSALSRIVSTEAETTSGIGIFAGIESNQSTRVLTDEKVAFVWFQILIEILVQMPQLPTARDEMIEQWRHACRTQHDQTSLNEFIRDYDPKRAIYWYTRQTPLYILLNRALRTENIDNIYKFRMFIVDLHYQLNDIFQSSASVEETLTVYRGQRMTVLEAEKLCGNLNSLISMNSFVSASVSEAVAHKFLSQSSQGQQEKTVKVFFKMTIHRDIAQQTNKPFADIQSLSYYPTEKEILLNMGTIFRIDKIEKESADFYYFHLTMCKSDIDSQLQDLFNFAKEQLSYSKNVNYSIYGKFLAAMSQFDSSIAYYNQLLSQIPNQLQLDEIALATIHNDLAYAYRDSRRQQQAFEHYQIALKLRQKQGSAHEEDLATTYSDFGWLLMNMDDFKQAIDFHERALEIRERILGHDNGDTAMSYNCLGLALAQARDLKKLPLALHYLEEALAIRQRCLPPQHPFIAMSYSSLGSYYEGISEYFHKMQLNAKALEIGSQALDMHNKALSRYKNSVPPTHVTLASSYQSVGKLYLNQRNWQRAIEHLTACAAIRRKHKSDNLAYTLHHLGQAYVGQGDYRQAVATYEEALSVAQKNNNNTLVRELKESIESTKQKIS